MFRIAHFAGLAGEQRAAGKARLAARQPQSGIHDMQIVIEQSKT